MLYIAPNSRCPSLQFLYKKFVTGVPEIFCTKRTHRHVEAIASDALPEITKAEETQFSLTPRQIKLATGTVIGVIAALAAVYFVYQAYHNFNGSEYRDLKNIFSNCTRLKVLSNCRIQAEAKYGQFVDSLSKMTKPEMRRLAEANRDFLFGDHLNMFYKNCIQENESPGGSLKKISYVASQEMITIDAFDCSKQGSALNSFIWTRVAAPAFAAVLSITTAFVARSFSTTKIAKTAK